MRVETKTSAKPEAPVAGKPAPAPAPTTAATTPATTTTAAAAAPASAAAAAKTSKPGVLASDTIATANELVYDDDERRARYTGTARMVGERGDLRGDRIELYFDESGHGVSRLEGFDNV